MITRPAFALSAGLLALALAVWAQLSGAALASVAQDLDGSGGQGSVPPLPPIPGWPEPLACDGSPWIVGGQPPHAGGVPYSAVGLGISPEMAIQSALSQAKHAALNHGSPTVAPCQECPGTGFPCPMGFQFHFSGLNVQPPIYNSLLGTWTVKVTWIDSGVHQKCQPCAPSE